MSGDALLVNPGDSFLFVWSGKQVRYLEWLGVLYGVSGPGSMRFVAPDTPGDYVVRILRGNKLELDRAVVRVQGVAAAEAPPGTPPPEEPPPPPVTEQLDIFLVNAATDTNVRELLPGESIDLNTTPEINFQAVANGATPGTIASIKVWLDGVVVAIQNAGPYSWFGDDSGDFLPWATPSAGSHTILAQAYDTDGATGILLASLSRTFTIIGTAPPPEEPPPPPPPTGALPVTVTSVMPNQTALDFALNPKGWVLTARDTFQRNIAQGEWGKTGGAEAFPKMTTGLWRWTPTDPSFNDSSGRGSYDGRYTTWVEGGEMRIFCRNAPSRAIPFVHQASGAGIDRIVGRPLLLEPGQALAYSPRPRRYAIRYDALVQFPGANAQGYKCAWLYWGHATIGNVGYAEEDTPEHRFGDGLRGNAFHHHEGTSGGQSGGALNVTTTGWHLWTIIYHAKNFNGHATGYVEFYVDGLLRFTRFTNNVSTGDVYFAMQNETFLNGDPIPGEGGQPAITSTFPHGTVRVRLFQIWEPA